MPKVLVIKTSEFTGNALLMVFAFSAEKYAQLVVPLKLKAQKIGLKGM